MWAETHAENIDNDTDVPDKHTYFLTWRSTTRWPSGREAATSRSRKVAKLGGGGARCLTDWKLESCHTVKECLLRYGGRRGECIRQGVQGRGGSSGDRWWCVSRDVQSAQRVEHRSRATSHAGSTLYHRVITCYTSRKARPVGEARSSAATSCGQGAEGDRLLREEDDNKNDEDPQLRKLSSLSLFGLDVVWNMVRRPGRRARADTLCRPFHTPPPTSWPTAGSSRIANVRARRSEERTTSKSWTCTCRIPRMRAAVGLSSAERVWATPVRSTRFVA